MTSMGNLHNIAFVVAGLASLAAAASPLKLANNYAGNDFFSGLYLLLAQPALC
jgi:hypothetical protein